MNEETLLAIVHTIVRIVEVAGIAVILTGAATTFVIFAWRLRKKPIDLLIADLRSGLGRSILLGLELLVAADIISTVAIEPTLDSLTVLAGIVAIRTFLSFSLEVEIEGRWPWQRQRALREGARHPPASETSPSSGEAAGQPREAGERPSQIRE